MTNTIQNKQQIQPENVLKSGCWVQENPESIFIAWDKLPFQIISTIEWRGIVFHVRIKSYKYEYGVKRFITFLNDNKRSTR